MSWSSGTILMSSIILRMQKKIPDNKVRHEVYKVLISEFSNFDCDTLEELEGIDAMFDSALKWHAQYD